MKITMTADVKTLTNAMTCGWECVNEIQPGTLTGEQQATARDKIHTDSRFHRGPGNSWSYRVDKDSEGFAETGTFEMNIDEDAINLALPMIFKVAKTVAPIVQMCMTAYRMINNLSDQVKSIRGDFDRRFNEAFGREKTYAVLTLKNEGLSMLDVVVVENDGFGNNRIIRADHISDRNEMPAIEKVFENYAKTRMVAFDNITKAEAIEKADEVARDLRNRII